MNNKFVCRDIKENRYLTYYHNSGFTWTPSLRNAYVFDTITETDNFASGAYEFLQKYNTKIEIKRISDIT